MSIFSLNTKSIAGNGRMSAKSIHFKSNASVYDGPPRRSFGVRKHTARPSMFKMLGEDASDKTVLHYEEIIDAQRREINELMETLADEVRSKERLQSDLQEARASKDRAIKAHAVEMARLESNEVKAMYERANLMHRLQQIEEVEDAVRALYTKMRDRIASEDPTAAELQDEIKQLENINSTNDRSILLVIGHLGAMLKSLWDFKVEVEAQMRGQQIEREAEKNKKILALQCKIQQLEAIAREEQQERKQMQSRMEAEAAAWQEDTAQNKTVLEELRAKNLQLLDELKAAADREAVLESALQLCKEEGKKRDKLVLKNKQLESAAHFDRLTHDGELAAMHWAHQREFSLVEKELNKLATVLRGNKQLKDQLSQAQARITSYKKAELGSRGLDSQLERLTKLLKQTEADLLRARQELDMWKQLKSEADVGNKRLDSQVERLTKLLKQKEAELLSARQERDMWKQLNSEAFSNVRNRPCSASGRRTSKQDEKKVESQSAIKEAMQAEMRQYDREKQRRLCEPLDDSDPIFSKLTNTNKLGNEAREMFKHVKKDVNQLGRPMSAHTLYGEGWKDVAHVMESEDCTLGPSENLF